MVINFPGSWHDNRLAYTSGLIHDKLSDEMTPPGFEILCDSAFTKDTKRTNGKCFRSRKENEKSIGTDSAELAAVDAILERAMPSERQSAEWGVRSVKGVFQRLKVPLSADSYKRYRIIRNCVHLVKFRIRRAGHN